MLCSAEMFRDMRTESPTFPTATGQNEPLVAKQIFSWLRGGSASALVLDTSDIPWVVKFKDNPQHERIVVNEYLATRMAQDLGFTVPECRPIHVNPSLIESFSPPRPTSSTLAEPGISRIHFASKFVGGLLPGRVADALPGGVRCEVVNANESAGILAFDMWVRNKDRRQNLFVRQGMSRRYRTVWIDNGHCFGAGSWSLQSFVEQSAYGNSSPHSLIDFAEFNPWLQRIERFPAARLLEITAEMPREWLAGQESHLQRMLEELISRRSSVRELLASRIRLQDWTRFANRCPSHDFASRLSKFPESAECAQSRTSADKVRVER